MAEDKKTNRYGDEDLQEFKTLIESKLAAAVKELDYLQEQIKNSSSEVSTKNALSLDEGSVTLEKEHINKMAARQSKYIQHLRNALIRIDNKTYGICRETGELINKKRLLIVPHATLSIAAKKARG